MISKSSSQDLLSRAVTILWVVGRDKVRMREVVLAG